MMPQLPPMSLTLALMIAMIVVAVVAVAILVVVVVEELQSLHDFVAVYNLILLLLRALELKIDKQKKKLTN